jgi:hypothetical protein
MILHEEIKMVNQSFVKFLFVCYIIFQRAKVYAMITLQNASSTPIHFFEPAGPSFKYFLLFPARMFKMTVDSAWDLTKSVTWQSFHFCDKVIVKTYSIAYMFFLKTRMLHLFDATWYGVKNALFPPTQQLQTMREIYWALGDQKWKEYVDGRYHKHGRSVFANASHGGSQELGYVDSQDRAAMYVGSTLGQKLTANMYLRIHSLVAGHFMGDDNNVCMNANNVGVFRRDYISCKCSYGHISAEALNEIASIQPTLFTMTENADGEYTLHFIKRTSDEIEKIFNQFTDEYYRNIASASTSDEKLHAIAWFYKQLELLHPVWDGSGRSSYTVLQKLLVENCFTPTILHNPCSDPSRLTTRELVQKIKDGFEARRNLLV